MPKYLLIESRDPFESRDVSNWCRLAADLRRAGNDVTLFLVQNAVLAARDGERSDAVRGALDARIEVLADDFSLRERGIAAARLMNGVKPAPLDTIVDALAAGTRTLWH